MIERVISFDRIGNSVDSLQRAAYRFSDRLACEIVDEGENLLVRAMLLDEDADADPLIAAFRNEVLDQVLRERIRAETAEVRNLVLAVAFSRTGLIQQDV
jgi:His-Xaa-Ser system protein HxsD